MKQVCSIIKLSRWKPYPLTVWARWLFIRNGSGQDKPVRWVLWCILRVVKAIIGDLTLLLWIGTKAKNAHFKRTEHNLQMKKISTILGEPVVAWYDNNRTVGSCIWLLCWYAQGICDWNQPNLPETLCMNNTLGIDAVP